MAEGRISRYLGMFYPVEVGLEHQCADSGGGVVRDGEANPGDGQEALGGGRLREALGGEVVLERPLGEVGSS